MVKWPIEYEKKINLKKLYYFFILTPAAFIKPSLSIQLNESTCGRVISHIVLIKNEI